MKGTITFGLTVLLALLFLNTQQAIAEFHGTTETVADIASVDCDSPDSHSVTITFNDASIATLLYTQQLPPYLGTKGDDIMVDRSASGTVLMKGGTGTTSFAVWVMPRTTSTAGTATIS